MTMTDPIADMLARIRNGQQAKRKTILVPASKLKRSILAVLTREGYVGNVSDATDAQGHPALEVELRYYQGTPVISEIKRVSRPGLRQYSSKEELPTIRNGLGTAVVSTSQGMLTDAEARERNVGGEVMCTVF